MNCGKEQAEFPIGFFDPHAACFVQGMACDGKNLQLLIIAGRVPRHWEL
jgi:hypothetical protein